MCVCVGGGGGGGVGGCGFNHFRVPTQIPTALSHHDLCNIYPMDSVQIYERVL